MAKLQKLNVLVLINVKELARARQLLLLVQAKIAVKVKVGLKQLLKNAAPKAVKLLKVN
jgi:hypothetical protein